MIYSINSETIYELNIYVIIKPKPKKWDNKGYYKGGWSKQMTRTL